MNAPLRSFSLLLAGLALVSCSSSPEEDSGVPRARGAAGQIKLSLIVESVDVQGRKITLKHPQGGTATYAVRPEVKRLNEVKAGDTLQVEYNAVAVAELRKPTPEEAKEPLVLRENADRAPSTLPPGAAFARAIRMVLHIEDVDSSGSTFTVRGPLSGKVRVSLDSNAARGTVKEGEVVVVTFYESVLLQVDPGSRK